MTCDDALCLVQTCLYRDLSVLCFQLVPVHLSDQKNNNLCMFKYSLNKRFSGSCWYNAKVISYQNKYIKK